MIDKYKRISLTNNQLSTIIDKIVSLYDEKIALYERMLKDKEAMPEELKQLLNK